MSPMISDLLTPLLQSLSRDEKIGIVEYVRAEIVKMEIEGLLNLQPIIEGEVIS